MINMPLSEWQEMQSKLARAQKENGELERKARDLERSDPTGRIDRLVEALDDALEIARYAVANLDPATVRGWPFKTLRALGERLRDIPGATADHTQIGAEFVSFSHEAETLENERVERDALARAEAKIRAEAEADEPS
jgi:hypothetical protein